MRTGILGGTFDPIHIAHLHAGESALVQADLDRVLFIPAGDPWQKASRRVLPGFHRFAMVELAVEGVDGLFADGRELARQGPTYTWDTLCSFPDDEELVLIVGSDAALGIPSWHRFEDVLARVSVLVIPRLGVDAEQVGMVLPDAHFLSMPALELSSTEIRQAAERGLPFRFLVTEPVFRYIEANNLYAEIGKGDIVDS